MSYVFNPLVENAKVLATDRPKLRADPSVIGAALPIGDGALAPLRASPRSRAATAGRGQSFAAALRRRAAGHTASAACRRPGRRPGPDACGGQGTPLLPSSTPLGLASEHSGSRPCAPRRSKRCTSRKVLPPWRWIVLLATGMSSSAGRVSSARCSHTSRSAQRRTAAESSAPENLTMTATGAASISRRAVNLGTSPAAKKPARPGARASCACCG